MTKAEFSKKAMEQYKAANVKDIVPEMNFIYSPDTIFRVWYDLELDNGFGNPTGGYMYRWCSVQKLENEAIFLKFDEILSEDNKDYPLILAALKKALKKNATQMIDHVHYKKGISITPIEAYEYAYTVKLFCKHCGIE